MVKRLPNVIDLCNGNTGFQQPGTQPDSNSSLVAGARVEQGRAGPDCEANKVRVVTGNDRTFFGFRFASLKAADYFLFIDIISSCFFFFFFCDCQFLGAKDNPGAPAYPSLCSSGDAQMLT